MASLKSKDDGKGWTAKSAELIADIDAHLDQNVTLKVRKELLEDLIKIFQSLPSEERDQMVTDWKFKIEQYLTNTLRENAEYQATIDSAPLV